jgi:hypothetical protein
MNVSINGCRYEIRAASTENYWIIGILGKMGPMN